MSSLRNESPPLPPRRPHPNSDLGSKRSSRNVNYFPPSQPEPPMVSTRAPLIPVSELSQQPQAPTALQQPSQAVLFAHVHVDHATAGTNDIYDTSLDGAAIGPAPRASRLARSQPVTRHSSLRYERRRSRGKAGRSSPDQRASLEQLQSSNAPSRPRSHPCSRSGSMHRGVDSSPTDIAPMPAIPLHMQPNDVWQLPGLQQPIEKPSLSRSSSQASTARLPKPRASFSRLSSLDCLITYREEKAEWKRASSFIQSPNDSFCEEAEYEPDPALTSPPETLPDVDISHEKCISGRLESGISTPAELLTPPPSILNIPTQPKNRFRHIIAEVGFCFTIAMTQFLAEYMISGFAVELPKLIARHSTASAGESMGMFWPASLLSLILSATLLIFARVSDMYGGYFPFMFGVLWLGIWSLVAGFADLGVLLDVARAMQGLAIAAFIPSTFAMVGSIYPEGPRKNIVLGLYSGCAPLGFFGGFLVAGALDESDSGWYFWIAAVLSFLCAGTAYLSVPQDRTDRKQLGLKMDWVGAMLITGGLILVAYALAVEPYAASGWSSAMVLGPLLCGLASLVAAFWVEGWWARCPLLPFDFFRPKSTASFSLACLCFYATYGVWLYESAQFFQSANATGTEDGIQGITLAVWYTPTAVGGLILCIAGGALLHIVPIMALLLVSAFAWIAAPLLLALCPLPMSYWAYVMPSMVCATLGIDLTFTVSVVFLSSVQPLRYQGLAGAVSSILVNLAMSFSLSISEIASKKAQTTTDLPAIQWPEYADLAARQELWGYRSAFIYGAASACIGLVICCFFVRISRSVVSEQPGDIERPRASSEASTLVEGGDR